MKQKQKSIGENTASWIPIASFIISITMLLISSISLLFIAGYMGETGSVAFKVPLMDYDANIPFLDATTAIIIFIISLAVILFIKKT